MRILLLLALGVVAVSLSGPLMAAAVVPPLAIAFWRNALATVALAPVVATTRREEVRALDRPTVLLLLGSGLALSVHFATWVTSLTLTSVASATALVCLQLAWVVLFQLLRGERFPAVVVVGLVVAFAGVLVVSGVDLTVSREAVTGDLLALAGGAAAAVYTVIGARARRTTTTTTYTFACYGTCAVVMAVACLVSGQALGGYPLRQWGLLLLVTVTAQLLGHSVFNHVIGEVGAVVVSLVLLLEVPGASLIAALLLGQRPPAAALLGLVVVLAGMVTVVLGSRSREPEELVEARLD